MDEDGGVECALRLPAHGPLPPPPDLSALLYWASPPVITLVAAILCVGWLAAVRRIDTAHPQNRVPPKRTAAFLGAMVLLLVALQSGLERYDTTLFSAHMVQHLLLLFPIPILLLRAGPMTLLLRLAAPRWRARLLAVLESRVIGVLGHPLVAWITFVVVLWATHLSPLFDLALEEPLVHDLEHALYLGSALLFWAPLVATDPVRHRLSRAGALGYLITQMPQSSFLGVAIMWAPAPLYAHYATLARNWGPTPLEDQQLAGAIMWLAGDALFLVAIFAVLAVWARAEERGGSRYDLAQVDVATAEIRRREIALAERLRNERVGTEERRTSERRASEPRES